MKMRQNIATIILAFLTAAVISSCDDPEIAFNENTFDIPYLFSEGYQDTIKYPYELASPPSDWLSMVKDDTKVCKLSIPGTHDSMTGMGFYLPELQSISNITAISQLCTFDEQMNSGIRFFDLRPVVSIDTLATTPADRQILRLAHGFTEINVTFEQALDWMKEFLVKHPSEFFIIKIQADNGMESQQNWTVLLHQLLSKAKYDGLFVNNWRPDITVSEMRIPMSTRKSTPWPSARVPSITWKTSPSRPRSTSRTTTRQPPRSAWRQRRKLSST